jgi:hypothetical protein
MMLCRVLVAFVFVVMFSASALGQKYTCSCDPGPGRTCHGEVKCPDGCTSLCGSGDTCYLACRSNSLQIHITAKLVQKTGQEIAAELSAQSQQRVEFTPYTRTAKARYDLELRNDDLFHALAFLSEKGNIRFNGYDFSELRDLRKQLKDGKRISVNFTEIPVKEALSRLAFFSGEPFGIEEGDPEQKISVVMKEATLDEIIERISKVAQVTIRR